jgi:hypothetical protein
MRTQLQNAASDTVTQTINTFTSRTEPAEQTAHANNHTYPKVRTTSGSGPKTPVFPMSPEGVEQLHRYQRSGTGSSKQAGNKRSGGKAMAAPTGRLNWKSPGGEYSRISNWGGFELTFLFSPTSHEPTAPYSSAADNSAVNYHVQPPIW